jgi:hypothetical protein
MDTRPKFRSKLGKEILPTADVGLLTAEKLTAFYRPKYAAFFAVNSFHFSGRSSSAKMAETGQTGTQAPQSIHSTGSM